MKASRSTDLVIALGLLVSVSAVTCAASSRQGVHRDEAVYMQAGEKYASYWERLIAGDLKAPFAETTLAGFWGRRPGDAGNPEHPPLMKTLFGLSWRFLHRCDCAKDVAWHPGTKLPANDHATLGILPEITAFRLPTILLHGLLAALVYLFFLEAFGGRVGALAAALLAVAQPRAFFHAQTAAFDLPAAVLWFATAYAYFRGLGSERPLRAALVVGLLYGAFLVTKLQSFFLPLALGVHWLWLWLRDRTRPTMLPILAMAAIGPLVVFATWPYLWPDPVGRFKAYVGFHASHVHYNFEYLGQNFNRPPFPWHEPLGMLVTTAPVVLLALAACGAVLLLRRPRQDRAPGLLVALGILVPIAPFLTGRAPIFGETKHWLAAMPYLAILAGLAVQALADRVAQEWNLAGRLRRTVCAMLVAVAFAPALAETWRSHPYGLSHYNALAGGAPGGADLGMNRQFWGYSVQGLFDWLNNLPTGSRVYPHDWNHAAHSMALRDGLLRPDLKLTQDASAGGIRDSDIALVIHELHFNKYEYWIWNTYGHSKPAFVLTLDGVPLVTAYRRNQSTVDTR